MGGEASHGREVADGGKRAAGGWQAGVSNSLARGWWSGGSDPQAGGVVGGRLASAGHRPNVLEVRNHSGTIWDL